MFWAAITMAALLACFAAAPLAHAQITTVTVTNLNDSGAGSLRDAIANASAGQNTLINFQSGLSGTIALGSTLGICNGQTLTIQGPSASGIAVNGQGQVQVLSTCYGTTVTVSGLTIENGYGASTFGAGISNSGNLTVTDSTFSGNSAGGEGGAINNGGNLAVINSTFFNNSSLDYGGAIYNFGNLTLTNSTFSGNSGIAGGSFYNYGLYGLITVKNTILANAKSGANCAGGGYVSQGYNLDDDGSCGFGSAGDLNGSPAGLDPKGLQNNGGPTPTIALLPGSSAVDHVPTANCTDTGGNPVATDQRGIGRPQGPACDTGAYELVQSVPFASFIAQLATLTEKPYGYALSAFFTPGTGSTAITPATQAVTLQVGTYTLTLPAGSLKQIGRSTTYVYRGTVNGVATLVVLSALSHNRYSFAAAGTPVDLSALTNPVTVTLTIGNAAGSTQIRAARLR